MRIAMPAEHMDQPLSHLSTHYASGIVGAAMRFANACYTHSRLSLREFEGARMRTAQINGCAICNSFRAARDLAALGFGEKGSVASNGPAPDEPYYAAVADWRTSPLFSARERLAIEYAEGMGLDPQGMAHDEGFWARLKAAYSDDEIVDLSYCVAGWLGLGRAVHMLGLDSVCAITPVASKAA